MGLYKETSVYTRNEFALYLVADGYCMYVLLPLLTVSKSV